jgi:acyl-coenzyme A thioesterase PaaI-like protein
VPERPRASTVGLTVDFLTSARGKDVAADARVVRRTGSGICFIEVRVTDSEGNDVALALVTHQL